MTVEEISRRAKEKFIKAKKEFKDGDFFKLADNKGKTLIIGCFKSIDSDSYSVDISCHFLYFVKDGPIYTNHALTIDFDTYSVDISCHFLYFVKGWDGTVNTNHVLRIDFDTRDLIKASPQEVMFVVGKLKNSGRYYDRRVRKVKLIEKLF